ncbi:unnamed protein product [Menidia menidia]|uniref:(Atlantic silverside) hypothetical protein n=1 Tax=Menidia menidia TaxID=238744 RepID=A0A8S4BIX2_9TELE|nr:unnamed protein product [Menidia menidia]
MGVIPMITQRSVLYGWMMKRRPVSSGRLQSGSGQSSGQQLSAMGSEVRALDHWMGTRLGAWPGRCYSYIMDLCPAIHHPGHDDKTGGSSVPLVSFAMAFGDEVLEGRSGKGVTLDLRNLKWCNPGQAGVPHVGAAAFLWSTAVRGADEGASMLSVVLMRERRCCPWRMASSQEIETAEEILLSSRALCMWGGAVFGMPGLTPRKQLLGRGPGFCFHHHQRAPCPQSGDAVRGPGRESPPPGLDMTVMKAVQVERTSPPMDEGRELLFQRSDGEHAGLCFRLFYVSPDRSSGPVGGAAGRDHAAHAAPSDATLHGKLLVYSHPPKAAIHQGVNLIGEGGSMALPSGSSLVLSQFCLGLCFRLFYVSPDWSSGPVGGRRVGTMLPMLYPGITSHLQMSHKRDPTGYF